MQHPFFKNRGAVFMPDAVGGATSPTQTPAAAQSALGSQGGGSNTDMTAMFNQGIADQTAMYAKSMQQKEQMDAMQTEGDGALKTLKAVQM